MDFLKINHHKIPHTEKYVHKMYLTGAYSYTIYLNLSPLCDAESMKNDKGHLYHWITCGILNEDCGQFGKPNRK